MRAQREQERATEKWRDISRRTPPRPAVVNVISFELDWAGAGFFAGAAFDDDDDDAAADEEGDEDDEDICGGAGRGADAS